MIKLVCDLRIHYKVPSNSLPGEVDTAVTYYYGKTQDEINWIMAHFEQFNPGRSVEAVYFNNLKVIDETKVHY